VLRLLVGQRREYTKVKHDAAVGIERDDSPMRQADCESERLWRNAAQLLLEQAGGARVGSGIVPFIDAGAERQDDQLVFQLRCEPLHAFEACHRTTLPES